MNINPFARSGTSDATVEASAPPKAVKDKSPADRIRQFTQELQVSGKWLEDNFWKRADRHVQMYELNHYYNPTIKDVELASYDRIKVPYPYSNVRQLLSETFNKTPEPIVKPTKTNKQTLQQQAPEFTPMMTQPDGTVVDVRLGAVRLKAAINHCVKESNLKRAMKLCVLDSSAVGLHCLMLSAQRKSKVPKYERILYRNILFSTGVQHPQDSPWVCRRVVRPLNEVKDDENYDSKARTKLGPTAKLPDDLLGYIDNPDDALRFVVIWDRWDKKRDKHEVWADGCKDIFLIDEKISDKYNFSIVDDDFEADCPFTFGLNEEMISKPLGMGDIAPIENQTKELDKIRTMQMNHIKRFNRKYGVARGELDEQGQHQLTQGDDGAVVEFKSQDWPNKFQAIQDAPISSDVYRMDEVIQNDIQIISALGSNALSRGVGPGPNTLGEAQMVEGSKNLRLDEKRDSVTESFRRIFRLTAQFIQQYWIEEDVLLVSGDGSQPTDWLEFSPDEIRGEYDYDVDPETMRDNTIVYRKQMSDAITIAAPLLTQLNPQGVTILLREYLCTFPSLERIIDEIVPEHPQMPQIPGQVGQSGDLMSLIQTQGPQAVLDSAKNLPENEKQAIIGELNKLMPKPGAPSGSNIAGAANNIRVM